MFVHSKKFAIFAINKQLAAFSTRVSTIPGAPKLQDSKNVTLRGSYIKGNYNDLPNLIFFSELLDPVNNWIPFFTNSENRFLDYRNIWLVNPRNFGNSDRSHSYDLTEMADDVVRFMYENKISTATLGGHGFGAKLALAVGCYHAERVTGVFGLDSAPLDHRNFEAFHELRSVVDTAYNLRLKDKPRAEIEERLKKDVECPKWRKILNQNLVDSGNSLSWNFDVAGLQKNLQFAKADSLGYWAEKHGIYTGRACFIFPDFSRWVHLNTNTLAMLKVCARLKGFGHDIFCIQGDENPLNHWIYDFKDTSFVTARKLLKFLTLYDGVHVLLKDRSEIGGRGFVPDRLHSRTDTDWIYSEYSPAHVHHNWRFQQGAGAAETEKDGKKSK